jgi:hypothetical protein
MKKLIFKLRLFSLVSKLEVLILLLMISISSFAQDVDAKGTVNSFNSLYGDLSTLGKQWKVTECCGWSGTWTRRPNTNTFDGVWKHTNGTSAKDVVELVAWNKVTNDVTLSRKSMNGSYKAHFNPNSRTLTNGTTTWYQTGQLWSAVIQ